ncbi:MAG: hypothetical protein A2X11_04400 [Bacteroidetes bacterium GWE2_42_24]|nr:MAG: hypothetical protein A2X11_04400 [Bacteroidetes bacterium GWE2_42_24]OFY25232.1 MAG: hypothetical protein A2X09_10895 [Bacteroidetes bacterium GWF2_43_11]
MNEITFYLMKLIAGSAVMYLGYKFWLTNNQHVGMVRWYLLVSLVLPAVLPLVGSFVPPPDTSLPVIRVTVQAEAVVVAGAGASNVDHPFITSFFLYLIAAGFLGLLFVARLFHIMMIIRQSESLRYQNLRLHFSLRNLTPFSFFNNILISDTYVHGGRLRPILIHEAAHITQGHSYDVIFTEFMCILQWFNPFVWFFRSAIQQNHEYLADRAVLKVNCNPANYKALLLESLTGISVPVVNSFNHSSLKKRFIMLNKPISGRGAYVQTLATVLFLTVMAASVILAFQRESFAAVSSGFLPVMNDDTTTQPPHPYFEVDHTDGTTGKSLSGDFVYPETAKNSGKQGTVYISFVVSDKGVASGHKVLRGFDKACEEEALRVVKSWKWKPALKNGKPVTEEIVYPIKFSLDGTEKNVVAPGASLDEEVVFQVVEEMPEFPGGKEAMASYLAGNIIYPPKARKDGIQGVVFVTFVVEKDGSVTEAKVLRGIGSGCDEVALEAVKKMPRWTPGTQRGKVVRVQMNIPVKFTLDITVNKNEKVVSVVGKTGTEETFSIVEKMPEFPGGDEERSTYLNQNLKYPEDAIKKRIQGTVYVTFVVGTDGTIEDVKVLRGIGGGCDEAAVDVIKAMPKWKPGTQRGKVVRVQYNMPVKFTLSKDRTTGTSGSK